MGTGIYSNSCKAKYSTTRASTVLESKIYIHPIPICNDTAHICLSIVYLEMISGFKKHQTLYDVMTCE